MCSREHNMCFDRYEMGPHHAHIGAISFCQSDAAVFHDPLVRPPLLSAVAGVVAEPPGAVHQHLLGQNLQKARLKGKDEALHQVLAGVSFMQFNLCICVITSIFVSLLHFWKILNL